MKSFYRTKKKDELNLDERINRQNINKSYYVLYLVVLIMVAVMGVVSYLVFHESIHDILKDTVGNLVGVLAAFMIFDILHEKLSKDSYSKEMSKNIMEALMANPEILDSFSQDQRNAFINSIVKSSVVDDDVSEMIGSHCIDYLTKNNYSKIKTRFEYNFELQTTIPSSMSDFSNTEDYYYVKEILSYTVKHIGVAPQYVYDGSVYIGLMFDNNSLDSVFRSTNRDVDFNKCIFRENLDIKREDIEYLRSLSEKDFRHIVDNLFKFSLQIERSKGTINSVCIKPEGILVRFDIDMDTELDEYNVRIIFHMPKLYSTVIQAVISDPTKAPKFTLSYPEDYMSVEMHSFLSNGLESSNEVAHEQTNGVIDIAINSEWIYPISGLVFEIEKKQ